MVGRLPRQHRAGRRGCPLCSDDLREWRHRPWINDHAGHGKPARVRQVFGATGSLDCPGDRNGRPIKLHLDDGTVIDDERILEYAPSYRLGSLAAELFGGERPWTYSFEFNDTDRRILALQYHESGECIQTGTQPEVTGEEGRADVALNYAPFEAGRAAGGSVWTT